MEYKNSEKFKTKCQEENKTQQISEYDDIKALKGHLFDLELAFESGNTGRISIVLQELFLITQKFSIMYDEMFIKHKFVRIMIHLIYISLLSEEDLEKCMSIVFSLMKYKENRFVLAFIEGGIIDTISSSFLSLPISVIDSSFKYLGKILNFYPFYSKNVVETIPISMIIDSIHLSQSSGFIKRACKLLWFFSQNCTKENFESFIHVLDYMASCRFNSTIKWVFWISSNLCISKQNAHQLIHNGNINNLCHEVLESHNLDNISSVLCFVEHMSCYYCEIGIHDEEEDFYEESPPFDYHKVVQFLQFEEEDIFISALDIFSTCLQKSAIYSKIISIIPFDTLLDRYMYSGFEIKSTISDIIDNSYKFLILTKNDTVLFNSLSIFFDQLENSQHVLQSMKCIIMLLFYLIKSNPTSISSLFNNSYVKIIEPYADSEDITISSRAEFILSHIPFR